METQPTDAVNPFAPPAELANALPPRREDAMWRQGKKLVILQGTDFSPLCVKSGEPADISIHKTFSWVDPIWYVLIFLGLFPAILVLMVLTKKAKFYIPITNAINDRRKQGVLIAWLIALAGLLVCVAGVVMLINEMGVGGVLLILGILILLAGLIVGSRASSLITPAKITADFVWFNGVHESLLDSLPPWEPRYEKDFRATGRLP